MHLMHRYFLLQEEEAMQDDPRLFIRADIPEYYLTEPQARVIRLQEYQRLHTFIKSVYLRAAMLDEMQRKVQ